MRVLVVRNDRLGDALLALPSVSILRRELPEAQIDFLCNLTTAPAVRPWLVRQGVETLTTVVPGELRNAYDAILFLHADTSLMFNAWKEWVPLRLGIYSKPASYLLLNSGLTQHRSKAFKNEAEYNLDLSHHLLKKLGFKNSGTSPAKIVLPINKWEAEKVGEMNLPTPYHVIHPGTGGSALNYSIEGYQRLLSVLLERELNIVLSQGPSPIDEIYVKALKSIFPRICVLKDLTLLETMELFRNAETVTAPSTGPLHLAHYVGTAVVGIYSPLRSQNWKRWAPWGGMGEVRVSVPDIACPAKKQCLGKKCREFFCMDPLLPEDLILTKSFV